MILVNIENQKANSDLVYFDKDIYRIFRDKDRILIYVTGAPHNLAMASEISAKNAIAEIRHAFLDGKNHIVNFTVANTGKAVYFVK